MSEQVERRIYEMLGEPTESPYGNPIPGLEAIGDKLDGVRERAIAAGLRVRTTRQIAGDDRQLLVSDSETEVKVEVNQVFRGSVLPPRIVSLHPAAEEMFATDVADFDMLAVRCITLDPTLSTSD